MTALTERWAVHRGIAALYVMGSVGFCYLAMWLGVV